MSLRTDKNSGLIVVILGACLISMAVAMTTIFGAQKMVSTLAGERSPSFEAMHSVLLTYLSLSTLGGFVYMTCGIYIRRGSTLARRIAQANTLCAYVWSVAYMLSCYQLSNDFPPIVAPEWASEAIRILSGLGGAVICFSILTCVLYVLSRPSHVAEA